MHPIEVVDRCKERKCFMKVTDTYSAFAAAHSAYTTSL
ncbi:hypothetical protein A2U01_0106455 [Trifolium medium]|uniref:DUF630 domain-containing protein n=1 Tax=Trifolium medium TaxID=97028 RepID=A0A392VA24_9FABA|nr:hypothetical protein [Trifolium medium]